MYFRSYFVEKCKYIHFWKYQTFLKPKTNVSVENFLVRHLGSQNGHRLTAVLTISRTLNNNYSKSILVAMTTFLAVGEKEGLIITFIGGHLVIQYGCQVR